MIGRLVPQNLPGVIIHPILNPLNLFVTNIRDIRAFGDKTPDHPVLVLVRPALP